MIVWLPALIPFLSTTTSPTVTLSKPTSFLVETVNVFLPLTSVVVTSTLVPASTSGICFSKVEIRLLLLVILPSLVTIRLVKSPISVAFLFALSSTLLISG